MLSEYRPEFAVAAGSAHFSLIVDRDPVFAYTGRLLVHSLVKHVRVAWENIHVQCTPEVSPRTVDAFRKLGCNVHELERFGDGRYCNKLAQWENLRGMAGDHLVFLDTDMICTADFAPFLPANAIAGKIVDLDNPKLSLLEVLFERAGFANQPQIVDCDVRGQTFRANCNGGFYSVPKELAEQLFEAWRRRALGLLADIEPLKAVNKQSHVDQIAFCMAIHETGLPFEGLPSNVNYPLHLPQPKRLRESAPLALLHYHNASLNVVGKIEVEFELDAEEQRAVEAANDQITANFDPETFWDFRYRHFPERGSGVGSRGANLEFKRELIRNENLESASSILDVGCGDIEVVRVFQFRKYTGLDSSRDSLAIARARRPDWTFHQAPCPEASPAEAVLCFEVAIHQKSKEDYRGLIQFLASKTRRTLIVSGYDAPTEKIAANHMLYFHEPLKDTLAETGKFSSIEKIGSHSDVVIYRCTVREEPSPY